ncbi:MAG: TetR/AcrR family transcriptional regulator [Cyclobacteriaceae bacterium]|nr:TetR/AcrR family transcriptional regulator [Cyclobacteriaceae bacterium]
MQDISDQIIQEAASLFLKYGIKSVTMDDISRSMSISKKTVYQYFHDKNEIVNKVAKLHLETEKENFGQIQANAENAIEKLYRHSLFIRKSFEKMNPVVLYDLKKYYKEAWQLFVDYKKDVFSKSMIETLKEGIEQGYFRKNIDPEILITLRFEILQLIADGSIFPPDKYDFRDVQIKLFDHFIHGILTEKGHVLLNDYIKNHIQP